MVSSGEVSSGLSDFKSVMDNYSSAIDGIGGSWQGDSHDSIIPKVDSFKEEALSTITAQMEAFSEACGLFAQYKVKKEEWEEKCAERDSLANQPAYDANNNPTYAKRRADELDTIIPKLKEEMDQLDKQIRAALDSAQAGTVEAKSSNLASAGTKASVTAASLSSSSVVNGAISWAKGIANDNSYGYSMDTRWGNPNYDCSSLVISAYQDAGIDVKGAGATYTGDMIPAFTNMGFKWIKGNPDVNSLQPGDVLLNVANHAEMYIGNGQNVGAHSNWDGADGDSSGSEINIDNYYDYPWDGVLRYVGTDT